jgi:hypothetical protein
MRGHELSGVVVRAMGIWLIAQGILSLPATFPVPMAMVSAGVAAVVGAILFLSADGFVRTTYHRVSLDELEPPISK